MLSVPGRKGMLLIVVFNWVTFVRVNRYKQCWWQIHAQNAYIVVYFGFFFFFFKPFFFKNRTMFT